MQCIVLGYSFRAGKNAAVLIESLDEEVQMMVEGDQAS